MTFIFLTFTLVTGGLMRVSAQESVSRIILLNDETILVLKHGKLFKGSEICYGFEDIADACAFSAEKYAVLTRTGKICFLDKWCRVIGECTKLPATISTTKAKISPSYDNSIYILNQISCSIFNVDRFLGVKTVITLNSDCPDIKEFYIEGSNIIAVKNEKVVEISPSGTNIIQAGDTVTSIHYSFPFLLIGFQNKKAIIYNFQEKKVVAEYALPIVPMAIKSSGHFIILSDGNKIEKIRQ